MFEKQILNNATFNVRGLCGDNVSKYIKFDNRYEKAFCWHGMPTRTENKKWTKQWKHNMLPTKEGAYGLGFLVNEKWKNNIHKQWKENDRIAILQLHPPNIKEPKNIPTKYVRKEN